MDKITPTMIIRDGFIIMRDNIRAMAIFVLVIGGLSAVGASMGMYESGAYIVAQEFVVEAPVNPDEELLISLYGLLVSIAQIFGTYLLYKTLLLSLYPQMPANNRFWAYLLMSIVFGMSVIFGLIFLIIPGVIIMIRWSASSGFVIAEQAGPIDALRASWDATKGHSFAILFAYIGFSLVVLFFMALFAVLLIGISLAFVNIVSGFLEAVWYALAIAFNCAVFALVTHSRKGVEEIFA